MRAKIRPARRSRPARPRQRRPESMAQWMVLNEISWGVPHPLVAFFSLAVLYLRWVPDLVLRLVQWVRSARGRPRDPGAGG